MKKTQGVWERVFSSGLTLVNPYNATAKVTLPPGTYKDVKGKRVGPTVVMKRRTGLVLLLAK